ncbi:MAG: 5-(carboxyamino)imidazole ribonucleotide synthase [Candidatus Eisenbacteria bacterium]
MTAILPGAVIGILGGGQLGRMTALAARELGFGVWVLDPDPDCAARGVADRVITGAFDDAVAAEELARGVSVVTYEIEKIDPGVLAAVVRHAPLRPRSEILAVVQDRAAQKRWLSSHGYPVGPWREADTESALAESVRALGPCRAKTRRGGYDGRGQARLARPDAASGAWAAIGSQPCVVERELELAAEFSLLVARRPSGGTAVYPPAQNWHVDGILDVSVIPARLPEPAIANATRQTRAMADAFGLEGLLAVEWFLTRDGEILVNELAPRPHNTFHATQNACVTSQFEQFVRAVCDLPLGSTEVVRPTALANLLGDVFLGPRPPALEQALAVPGIRLHLYGKAPRRYRKVGHLLAVEATPEEAIARVREARRVLGG